MLDIQHTTYAPSLRYGTTRCERRICIVVLSHRADTVGLDIIVERCQHLLCVRQEALAIELHCALYVEHQRPYPYCTVCCSSLLLDRILLVGRLEQWITRRQRTKSCRSKQVLTHCTPNVHGLLLIEHYIWQTTSDHLVATNVVVLTTHIYIVGKIALLCEVEHIHERLLNLSRKRLPLLLELLVTHLICQSQSVGYSVVPQGIYLYGISCTRSNRLSVHNAVHPSQRYTITSCPNESVGVHCYATAKESTTISCQDALHCSAILLPNSLGTDMLLQLLQGPEEPEWSVCRNLSRSLTSEIAIVHIADHRVENGHTILLVALLQGQARKRDEGRTTSLAIPRVS